MTAAIRDTECSRRQFLCWSALGAAGATETALGPMPAWGASADAGRRPNVLFIIADDLGARLGCYNDSVARTPHIDQLAKRGVLFTNSFCQYPTCGPSRVSMLTGLYPHETGWVSNKPGFRDKNPDLVTLPQWFRQNGYFTARVGKVFHMGIPGGIGTPGDDDPLSWDLAVNNTGWDAQPENIAKAHKHGTHKNAGVAVAWLDPDIDDGEMADGVGVDRALKIMREHNPDRAGKPLFLSMGFYRPHPPMIAPRSHYEAISADSIKIPHTPDGDREDIPDINFHLTGEGFNFIPEDVGRAYVRAYYAAIHFVDHLVGRLLEGLRQNGLDDNTIIVFAGDQGFHLGEHGHWHKSTFFEQACRVPLIVADPRIKTAGQQSDALTGLIDVYPTLCDLAGLTAPQRLSGQSLRPQLEEVDRPGKPAEFTMGTPRGYSVRTDRYRYTEWDSQAKEAMLYDLHKDPHEWDNLVGHPEHAQTLQSMKMLLTSFRAGNTESAESIPRLAR